VIAEFSAQTVTLEVLAHLERRRPGIAADEARIRAEVEAALVPVERAYAEAQLPLTYFEALAKELRESIPARWRACAEPYTALERREFGLWRGGDPVARLTYVLAGLLVGSLIVAAPFIPIWEKWFPFVLAIGAWWVPTVQTVWHRRRYARALGEIAHELGKAQPRLDEAVRTEELLLPGRGDDHE
jgi:hypothetical protein